MEKASKNGIFIHFLIFLLCLVGMICRFRDRLNFPVLFGEDGPYFFAEAVCSRGEPSTFAFTGGHGVHALIPAASTAVLIERTLAQGIVRIAPEYAAQLFFLVSISLSTFILTYIVSSKFDWLIPSRAVRVILAMIFCLRAGTDEVTTNLIGFTYLGTWALALCLLRRPLPNFGVFLLLWILIPLSANTSAALIGLIACAYWISRAKRLILPGVLVFVSALLNFSLALSSPYREVVPRAGNPLKTVIGIFDRYTYETFAAQWIGPVIARSILEVSPLLCFVLSLVVCLSFFLCFRKLAVRPELQFVSFGLLSIPLVFFAMHSIARADRVDSPFLNGEVALGYRHSLFPSLIVVLISAFFLTAPIPLRSAFSRVGFRFFSVLPLLHNAIFPFIIVAGCPAYRGSDWEKMSELFVSGGLREASVPVLPLLKIPNSEACVPWAGILVRRIDDSEFECRISGGNY